ncbi:MAG: aminoacetone oxidase family FAD-binding enzyme [Bacteroidetes bacterium HGW-Bacteroidetes-9]|nr:MAG: aminoacetone oxidase family FAD-binding enzyme [Bacteroidetes bacterium HGW-Bacteroidetes-9]
MNKQKTVIVVGGGPAGLMAAWKLATHFEVHLFEKEKMLGQKFLLAGKGGFNLTNKLSGSELFPKYLPGGFLDNALAAFDSLAFREWLQLLGIPTFEGSSGRVFPEKGITPAQVLKKITDSLFSRGVHINLKHKLVSFNPGMDFCFSYTEGEMIIKADYALLALGGASWPSTGSDGKWVNIFSKNNINTLDFEPSNCGLNISWPDAVKLFHTGKPLKNISISINDKVSRGEALITEYGLEGNAVYPVVPQIRYSLKSGDNPIICLDFKPTLSYEQLILRILGKPVKPNNYSRLFGLNPPTLAIIKAFTDKETFLNPASFAESIKQISIPVTSLRPVEEAISSVGGLDLAEVNPDFSLKKFPELFAIGEMLDWDAPTGGFLLQGCFSMGNYAAQQILNRENL